MNIFSVFSSKRVQLMHRFANMHYAAFVLTKADVKKKREAVAFSPGCDSVVPTPKTTVVRMCFNRHPQFHV